jgi:hypothetical protein
MVSVLFSKSFLPGREEKSCLLTGRGLSKEITGPKEKWNANLLPRGKLLSACMA